MREEIESAQNQSSVHSKRFDKTPNNLLLSSQQSDLDPILTNTTINQSSSFKKLMNAVMGDTEF